MIAAPVKEKEPAAESLLPAISRPRFALFARYGRSFVRRHFNSIRLLKAHPLPAGLAGSPLVIFLNHSSWWDPLIGAYLSTQYFSQRPSYVPIDAQALTRYRFLTKCGFFGVEPENSRAAMQFLRRSAAILASPSSILWLTPQAGFSDVRARPVLFQRGLAHLAVRAPHAIFLPLALEYTFWEERLPEVLLAWGKPVTAEQAGDPRAQAGLFEVALQDAQDALAAAAQRRAPAEWEILLRGRAGVNAIYDGWRKFRAFFRGEEFRDARHSQL